MQTERACPGSPARRLTPADRVIGTPLHRSPNPARLSLVQPQPKAPLGVTVSSGFRAQSPVPLASATRSRLPGLSWRLGHPEIGLPRTAAAICRASPLARVFREKALVV